MRTSWGALIGIAVGLAACTDDPWKAAAPPPAVKVVIAPKTAALSAGGIQQFTATVTGATSTAVSWSVGEGAAGGAVSLNGLYTAPIAAGTYHVVATSAADSTKSDSATVTVVANTGTVAVNIAPRTAALQLNGTLQFSSQVSGTGNTAVTWAVMGSVAAGTINPSGLYTAPGTPGTYSVVVTAVADTSKTDSATVTVTTTLPPPPPAVPGNLNAQAACKAVTLSWNASPNATSYLVQRATSPGTNYRPVSSGSASLTFFDTDSQLAFNTAYSYQVMAVNTGVPSSPATVLVTTGLAAPAWRDPNGGSTSLYAGDTQVSMAWDASAVAGAGSATTYAVTRGPSATGPFTVISPANWASSSLTAIGLQPSTHYYFQVQATNGATPGCILGSGDVVTGAGGSAITQRGSFSGSNINLTDGIDQSFSQDLTTYKVAAISTAGGPPVLYHGEGTADGLFTIPNVPAGLAYVNLGGTWYVTSTRQFDLTTLQTGRGKLVQAKLATPVTFSLSGLLPWNQPSDHLEVFSVGGGNDFYLETATNPAANATSTTLTSDFNGSPLIDTTAGDVVTINHLAAKTGATPFAYTTIQQTCSGVLTPAAMADGVAAAVSCNGTFAAVPATSTATLSWTRSQMKALAAQGAPPGVTPVAAADHFYLIAAPGQPNYGLAALNARNFVYPYVLEMPLDTVGGDVNEALSYGNPFAANAKYGLVYQAVVRQQVPLLANATVACPTSTPLQWDLNFVQSEAVGALAGSIAPLVGPVSNLVTASQAQAAGWGTGVPLGVSWTAPIAGANQPTHYSVSVYQLGVDASCNTSATRTGLLRTTAAQTSVVLPPGLFTTQDLSGKYFVAVFSYWLPDEQSGLQRPRLFGSSTRNARVSKLTAYLAH